MHLDIWTVYYNPSDYPGLYVARRFRVSAGGPKATEDVKTGDTLEEIYEQLPWGLNRIPRTPADPPAVVEAWF